MLGAGILVGIANNSLVPLIHGFEVSPHIFASGGLVGVLKVLVYTLYKII